jgi:hypothetical protein
MSLLHHCPLQEVHIAAMSTTVITRLGVCALMLRRADRSRL